MTSAIVEFPRKLERGDIRDGFDSGARELDDWLNRFALQDQRANSATTYVSCVGKLVIGYYSITVGAVSRQLSKTGPEQSAGILISRLAVDRAWQGKGYGVGLLQDALERAALINNAVAAGAVLIYARDAEARSFYSYHLNYQASPVDDLQLMIPMKEVCKLFNRSPS